MQAFGQAVKTIEGCTSNDIPKHLLTATEPFILKGLAADWPLVKAGKNSAAEADKYIRQFYQGEQVGAFVGQPEIKGRFGYNQDMTGFNYQNTRANLTQVLDKIQQYYPMPESPSVYVGSTSVDMCLPGFRQTNDLQLATPNKPLVSVWISNRSRISAHFDLPDNIAVNAVGKRRFTLFPPDQLENLYVGPLEFNPAGQAISLVDFHQPDFARFPKFKTAMENAWVAELEPGDAVFVPSMWWHHVESLTGFNVLVNYWWRQSPNFMETPAGALTYAQMTIRDLPEAQKQAWKNMFDYYVFSDRERAAAHIPEHCQASVGKMTADIIRRLRGIVLNRLNR